MAEHLIECDDHDMAQQIIIDGLKRQYDDRLVLPIPRLRTNNPEQLEKVLRQQIKTVGDRPLLWSTLGQSLMKHGEWQEATTAFRAALKQRPDAYDYARLADALDRLHQPEEAAAMRRDGLMLTLQNNPRSNSLLPGGASLTGLTAYAKSFGMHKNACPVKGQASKQVCMTT